MAVYEADLERMLRDVAAHIEWPPEPQLATRVRVRLAAGPAAAPSLWERFRPLLARPAFAVTITVVILCSVLIASESARVAVADFLGLDGVRVEFTKKLPEGVGSKLDLGEKVTLDDAQESVAFDVLVPTVDDLDAPDGVFFDPTIGEGQVSLVYAPRLGLPATPNESVGLLVMEYQVSLEDAYYKKLLQDTNTIEEVAVGSDPGFWVRGPHTIEFRDDGSIGRDEPRLAGNTLLWEHDGVTIRLESALSKSQALRIAESME
ncbi:MAG: hypothetical protein ACRDJV_13435 [Actinomycetota bacterium]